ncbi:hypothetical protein PIROE2DRAFT_15659 [Piromyces sp. E2]|nr:hypothetical protein PIROE2DRAFT_15659 [Piromyces sp. E2]|eukprot:OUM58949.1 hypothetical protein PIROE2DRAFT_15659 [Piromyces sp. E2]
MKYLYLFFFIILGIYYIGLVESQKIELVEDEEEDEETIFTGTVIKYLNVTEIEEMKGGEGGGGGEEDEVITSATKVFNKNFYNQLNSNEKALFDFLYEQCSQERPKTQYKAQTDTYVDKNKVTMEKVMTSLVLDNPQFWWIESYSISLKNAYKLISGDQYKKVTNVTVDFMTKDSILKGITDDQIYEMNQELQFETELLLYQIELMNIHSKFGLLRFLHDYIIRNVVYNTSGTPGYVHTIYGALVKHEGVCSGYSELFKYIASFFGINVVLARKKDETTDVVHRPDKGDYSNLIYSYFLVGSDAFKGDEVALTEHELIYSYFTKNNVIVYPIPEKKRYEYSPLNDEYVERIPEIEETETENLDISDTHLNSPEDHQSNSFGGIPFPF